MLTLLSRRTLLTVLLVSTSVQAMASSPNGNRIVENRPCPGLRNGMDYVRLGQGADDDLLVSRVCMGTMTFGQQNTVEEGVAQLNRAFDEYGINFLDTAEMYPVPTTAETQGATDEAVKQFLAGRKRQDVVVATKVAGRSDRIDWLPRRKEKTLAELTKEQILDSVDASLERLGIDCIDLLQLHWPDRYTGGLFGSPDFSAEAYEKAPSPVEFEEQLDALQQVIREGKVRFVGVSNETPFGVCQIIALAERYPDLYPRIVSIQNSFSLVVRKDFEAGLTETCYHHNVGLLAYSPLASGTLSGKYQVDEPPAKARLNLFPGFMSRYKNSINSQAVDAYCALAAKHEMSPSVLALAWCYHNPNVASTIIGATTMEQLEENLLAYDQKLDDTIQEEIAEIYKKFTDPTKARNNV